VDSGQLDLGGGAELHWWASGFTRPLLLVHPSGTDHSLWDPMIGELPADRDTISYDLRGHGCSPPGSGTYRHSDDLLRLLYGLGLEHVDVVGASYGGQVAAEAAAAAPERVRALALLGPSMSGHAWSEEATASARAQAAALAAGDEDEAVRVWMDTWVRGPRRDWANLDPALRDRLEPPLRRSFAWAAAAAASAVEADPGWAARLAAVRRPALVAVGGQDLDDCGQIACALGDLLAVRPVVLPGAGHLLPVEDPAATGALLTDFLAALE
jgi:pimeloyl-ACP methyl ester carboxylesterase